MPMLSIITATYNVEQTVTACLKSLRQQSIPFEHLVIDGLSTDATLEKVREHSPNSAISSEKDNGLYDALNKGIRKATGGVIGMLHADDVYAGTDVLEQVADVFADPQVDACYGDLLYVNESDGRIRGVRYWQSGAFNPRKFYWGWMPPHPTFFVRRSVYEKYGAFNLNLGTAADYELMLRFLVKHGIRIAYIPEVLVHMRTGGISNASVNNRFQANRMDRKAWEVNGLQPYPWTIPLKPIRKIPQWWTVGRADDKRAFKTPSTWCPWE